MQGSFDYITQHEMGPFNPPSFTILLNVNQSFNHSLADLSLDGLAFSQAVHSVHILECVEYASLRAVISSSSDPGVNTPGLDGVLVEAVPQERGAEDLIRDGLLQPIHLLCKSLQRRSAKGEGGGRKRLLFSF